MPPQAFEAGDSKLPLEPEVAEDAPIMRKAVIEESFQVDEAIYEYRVYKRRWIGLVALFLLNVTAGASFTSAFSASDVATNDSPILTLRVRHELAVVCTYKHNW